MVIRSQVLILNPSEFFGLSSWPRSPFNHTLTGITAVCTMPYAVSFWHVGCALWPVQGPVVEYWRNCLYGTFGCTCRWRYASAHRTFLCVDLLTSSVLKIGNMQYLKFFQINVFSFWVLHYACYSCQSMWLWTRLAIYKHVLILGILYVSNL